MPSHHDRTGADAAGADAPLAHVLSNGRYTTLLTAAGGGFSAFGGLALTRWTPDRTRDVDGFHVYVRDVATDARWGAGLQPVPRPPARYLARFGPGHAELAREDDGVETRLEVCVAPDDDVEVRRLTLTNRGDRPRRLEVTTYAEAALNAPAADASHPAFSKLFVQTELAAGGRALLARRRPRSPDDEPLWVAHLLEPLDDAPREDAPRDGAPEHETDRARFVGRGRTLARPRALDPGTRLSGTVGAVLDPVLALRRVVELAPGASARLVAVLAAGTTRHAVDALAARYGGGDADVVDAAFASAAARAARIPGADGTLAAAVGALAYAHPAADDVTAWRTARDDRAWFDAARALAERPTFAPGTERDAARRMADAGIPAFAGMTGEGVAGHPRDGDRPRDDRHPHETGELLFFNGHGGFAADGSEYVVRVDPGAPAAGRPPLPWTNVVANERVGFIASESGAGGTWSVNSRENRLTPWLNDPVTDPHGEALYLRDEDDGALWSPTPGPIPGAGHYEARHGFGYTRWRHDAPGLASEVLAFVPHRDPVKVVRLRVTNHGDRARRLSAYWYAQLVLGVFPWETAPSVATRAEAGALYATNPRNGEFATLVAFAAVAGAGSDRPVELTADRAEFLGRHGSTEDPAAPRAGTPLSGRAGAGLDPCAAFRVPLEIAPGETAECTVLLGQAGSDVEARSLVRHYRQPGAVDAALDVARAFWRDLLAGVRIETPSPALDLVVNGWLSYQNLSCRVWGRSAFYQSGGAFGFRDQLQDTAALVHLAPELTREQIVLHAAHQFVEGDVLHWWHPPTGKGIRTRFADDLLWLPYVATYYVETTGDASVLDEDARFVTARPLEPGEDEAFLVPGDSGERASVYEHCCRAIDRSLPPGAHGLPLMGTGDWNDGMNRVGREGRGESVWLGFFLLHILDRFAPIVEARGDAARASAYRARAEQLARALNAGGAGADAGPEGGWDGAWYRRAYYDDGTPLGAATNDECRIDTIAQAWAVLSRAAPPDRATRALDAMEAHLVAEDEGIIRLLAPAFDRTPHDPGYIKGYVPGVRENGGQYTHAALWAVRALAELGRADRAARLLEMLSPASHARSPEEVATYRVEPYVVAADVYGVAPHVGRGGWTWYTGSAGWMFRVAVESVLGLTLDRGATLVLRPCVPPEWPGFTIRYRLADRRTTYEIVARRGEGPTTARVDGGAAFGAMDGAVRIPVRADGGAHRVEVALGDDVGPRYAQRETGAPATSSRE